MPSLVERLWAKIDVRGSDDCWPWTGGHHERGYGLIGVDGCTMRAHRLVFALAYGWTPKVVRHSCDNPPCCNPKHLRGGTQKENVQDAIERGRRIDLRGESHGNAVLTERAVMAMRQRYADHATYEAIAREFGVSVPQAASVCTGRAWKHLPLVARRRVHGVGLCGCGCGTSVRRRFVRGHARRIHA